MTRLGNLVGAAVLFGVGAAAASGQMSTAFSYQGQLRQDGVPVNDTVYLEFALWDAEVGGTPIGGVVTLPDVEVEDGLFTVRLDFGNEVWSGGDRWLELAVQCCGEPLTVLEPRQLVTPAPRALSLPGLHAQAGVASPSLIGGYEGNVIGGDVEGAVIDGGGALEDLLDGRCSAEPDVLCLYDDDCAPDFGVCVPDPMIGRCSEDPGILCDDDGDCQPDAGSCMSWTMENRALGNYAVIGGGLANVAGGGGARGGRSNSWYATIAGGYMNSASDWYATIGGGYRNEALRRAAKVAGGYRNRADARYAAVGGGYMNEIVSPNGEENAAIGGGYKNYAKGHAASIGGGYENKAEASQAAIAGGLRNRAEATAASVGGGEDNVAQASAQRASIAGGLRNEIAAPEAAIGGGQENVAQVSALRAAIAGGLRNQAGGVEAAIAGGFENEASGARASVGGGYQCKAQGAQAAVPGGRENEAGGVCAMAAGRKAKAQHDGTFVWADNNTNAEFASTGAGQFLVRAPGGMGVGTNSPSGALHVKGGSVTQWDGGPVEGYGKTSVYTNEGTLDASGTFAEMIPASFYSTWLKDNFFFKVEVFVSLDIYSSWPHDNRGGGYSMALIGKQRGDGLVHFNEVITDAMDATFDFAYSSPQTDYLRIEVDTNRPGGTPYRVIVKISH
jgi:hypothetical protein